MAKYNETEIATAINMIGAGTEIIGDVNSNGDIRIDGILTGNLKTAGKVVIGETGKVKGEINCKNSEVLGEINGKIKVGELLSLKATSNILGDIETKKLAIEPGSKFTGNCRMGDELLKNVRTEEPKFGNKEQKKAPSDFAKYSALGFQMIAIIMIGVVGGMKLDQWITGMEFPLFTMLLSISSVIFATYYAIKDFIKPPQK